MKKLIALCLFCVAGWSWAEDINKLDGVYYKTGPIEMTMPLRSVAAVYAYDFHEQKNLIGGETPVLTLWDKLEGNIGVNTTLQGRGSFFGTGTILIGNLLERYITLPEDVKLGGFGGWDFRREESTYGLKASYKIW